MAERRTKYKVLVVDDEQMIRYTLTEALRGWDYGVSEAGTVAAGLATFDVEQPDIVLLAINLPDGVRVTCNWHPEPKISYQAFFASL